MTDKVIKDVKPQNGGGSLGLPGGKILSIRDYINKKPESAINGAAEIQEVRLLLDEMTFDTTLEEAISYFEDTPWQLPYLREQNAAILPYLETVIHAAKQWRALQDKGGKV